MSRSDLLARLADLRAERARNALIVATYKVGLNATFGKLGSRFSFLYAPELLIQVTITGQLALLMLIERVTAAGATVVSANTDGIVMRCPKVALDNVNGAIKAWEATTGLVTEESRYSHLWSRDVNAYVARKVNGGFKLKGPYANRAATLLDDEDADHMHNPASEICIDAMLAWLSDGTSIVDTILGCRDIRKFLIVRRVTGGAMLADDETPPGREQMIDDLAQYDHWVEDEKGRWLDARTDEVSKLEDAWKKESWRAFIVSKSTPVGKVVRWYHGAGRVAPLRYLKDAKKVPSSDGAVPLMDLPDEFPTDVRYGNYVETTLKMLKEIAAI